VQAYLGLKD